jgi:hypothetical protein
VLFIPAIKNAAAGKETDISQPKHTPARDKNRGTIVISRLQAKLRGGRKFGRQCARPRNSLVKSAVAIASPLEKATFRRKRVIRRLNAQGVFPIEVKSYRRDRQPDKVRRYAKNQKNHNSPLHFFIEPVPKLAFYKLTPRRGPRTPEFQNNLHYKKFCLSRKVPAPPGSPARRPRILGSRRPGVFKTHAGG